MSELASVMVFVLDGRMEFLLTAPGQDMLSREVAPLGYDEAPLGVR